MFPNQQCKKKKKILFKLILLDLGADLFSNEQGLRFLKKAGEYINQSIFMCGKRGGREKSLYEND